jgi:quinoprotein glucose dehydrogenase
MQGRYFWIPAVACSVAFAQPSARERGKAVFEGKGQCLGCHRVAGNGSHRGPELTEIGSLRKPGQIERSLLEPDADIAPQNRSYRVVTRAGESITGRVLNLDAFSVQLMDSQERLRSFLKTNLKDWGFLEKSPMPSSKDKLSPQELADVVSYLESLQGIAERNLP